MKYQHQIASSFLFLLSITVTANASSIDALISACRKERPTEFGQCIRTQAAQARADVKNTENAVRASIAASAQDRKNLPVQKSAFEASVEAFRKYRQRECAFVASSADSAADDLRYACYAELDAIRADRLRAWIARATMPQ